MDLTIETDTFDPDSHFLFWKPGGAPRVEPDGMAWRLDPGNDLVLNVHMQPSGKPETVQPSVGLYFTDKPPAKRPMLVKLENDRALDIPPGDARFPRIGRFSLPLDVDVLAVYPHAHYLGKLLEAFATLPDGSRRWLIRIPRVGRQLAGRLPYRTPVFLPKGTVVSMRYHYDNSAANPRNPNSPPEARDGRQPVDGRDGAFLAAGAGPRRRRRAARFAGSADAPPSGKISRRCRRRISVSARCCSAASRAPRRSLTCAKRCAWRPRQAQAVEQSTARRCKPEGRVDEAIEQFRHALRIQPDYPNARFNLANGLLAEGKLPEAAAGFRLVLAAVPGDRAARGQLSAALAAMGDAAAARGEFSSAADNYRELVALEPLNADLRNNFGIILAKLGDLHRRSRSIRSCITRRPRASSGPPQRRAGAQQVVQALIRVGSFPGSAMLCEEETSA